jgi:glutamine---fructose-6-phosphate transaminase (isomerizing)
VSASSAESPPDPPAGETGLRGARFIAEIREQPEALRRLLEHEDEFRRVAKTIREREATTIRMVGHGSSDNAASYGVYAFGLLPRWTALRDSISLLVYYGADLDLSGSTVLALSQSGQTPDVVRYLEEARLRGAFTVAITNDPSSELARAAEAVLPLAAGPELAVAATKTYVNQVAALGLLAAHAAGVGSTFAEGIAQVATQLAGYVSRLESVIAPLAMPFAFAGRMFVVGRGAEFATAREIALKLLETCRVAAEPLTATDLAHGPVAALDPLFPVWAIASDDAMLPAVLEGAARAKEAGATLIASGNAAGSVAGADYTLEVPTSASPLLAPLLSVVPGQLFAWALARTKGLDPDEPRGLSKVTLAT